MDQYGYNNNNNIYMVIFGGLIIDLSGTDNLVNDTAGSTPLQ